MSTDQWVSPLCRTVVFLTVVNRNLTAPGEENERWEAKGGQIVRLGGGGGGTDVRLSTHLPSTWAGWRLGFRKLAWIPGYPSTCDVSALC